MSLTTCIAKAGKALHPDDKAALIERARVLRGEGKTAAEAATQAVDEQLAAVRGMLPQEKAAEPKPATPGKVENFGEVLPPSRRAKAAALMAETSDADIAAKPLSEIWPLSENEAIEDKFAAAVAHAARAEVPAKPRQSYKLKRWVEQVKTVRGLAQKIVGGSVTREQFIEQSKTFRLEGFMAKVALLEAIDRAQWKRIGDVREAPDAGRYEGTGPDSKFVREPQVFVEIDGKGRWMRGGGSIADHIDAVNMLLGTEAQAKRMEFEVRGSGSTYFINKKGDSEYRRLKTFTTSKEAIEYKRANYADLVQAWESVKERDNVTERDLRSDANKDRIGPDRRQGRDITGEEFDKTFGFKGGEFGKWVSQGAGAQERQWMLNRAYDAFMDLAELVGIPPRAVSLNGTLGIAFGSRGSGWASAHFEPGNLVINLTKTRGAGALAHEWFHALDNYFARMRGGEVPMSVVKTAAGYRQHNYVTYKAEPLMVRKDGKGTPTTKADLERMRAANPSSGYLAADNWQVDPKHPQGVRPEVEERFAELVKALNAAPMTQRARMIDKGGEGYWSQIIERAARSFEAYVIGRMAEKGQTNEYLANVTPLEDFKRDPARYPYPTPAEIRPVAEAFDSLFDTIETREEDGNTLLFDLVDAGGTQPDNTPRGQEPTRTAAARAVADLAAELTRDVGKPVVLEHVAAGQGLPGRAREHATVAQLAREQFGHEVAWLRFRTEPLFNGIAWGQRPGMVFLRADSPRPLMAVLGHELLHKLRATDPRLYWELNKRLTALLQGENRYRDELEQKYKDKGLKLPLTWLEELHADIVGDFFTDKQFWRDLAAKDKPLFQRMSDAVLDFLDDVAQWFTKTRPFGTEQYLKDIDAARAAVVDAMRAFSERQTLAPLGGGTQLSVATDTDAFKRWFGDSKAVDKDGKPLVVYHGTGADVSEFRPGVAKAIWFAPDAGYAGKYVSAQEGASNNVIPVFLTVTNPLTVDMRGGANLPRGLKGLLRYANSLEDVVGIARQQGHDGVIFKNRAKTVEGFAADEVAVFEPTQIKSATGNRGTFDPASADIRLSIADPTLKPSTGPLDTILRKSGGTLLGRLTSPTYDKLLTLLDRGAHAIAGDVYLYAKAGTVADYGLTPDYQRARHDMETGIRKGTREAATLIERLQTLDRAQARIAYLWMQEKPDTALEQQLLDNLPDESRQTLLDLKQRVDELGKQAVDLGLLTQDTYDRNAMAYLHRSYQKYETQNDNEKTLRARSVRIMGDQFKGRGLRQDVGMASIGSADWWQRKGDGIDTSLKGQKFHRLELRRLDDETTPDLVGDRRARHGKLEKLLYWPASEPIPPQYADWRNDGLWEARFFDKAGKVGMWRDFTLEERTQMGEIQEVRYSAAKTILQATRDVETARLLDWVARNHSEMSEDNIPEGHKVVKATESLTRAYLDTEWVQVPSSLVPGTKVPRYGNLAGRFVPGPVWNDIRQISALTEQGDVARVYGKLLTLWKISKTALSPATHMNNVMSNFILADAHDIQGRHMLKAAQAWLRHRDRGNLKADPAAKKLIEDYQDNGGDGGKFNEGELREDVAKELLDQLERDVNDQPAATAQLSAAQVFDLLSHREFRQAFAMIGATKTAQMAGKPVKLLTKLYGREDELFRLAAFIKARDDGLSDREAGEFARTSFLDYRINAPWINAARRTAFPFIAFTYRAVPMLLRTFADKPWKLAKYALVGGLLNALGYAIGGGDEDRERALLPDEKSGKIWGIFPKLIRMPWNDEHGSPVFLDVRRWVPGGDIADTNQNHAAVPIPAPLLPGGPMVILAEVIGNKQWFTGKDITKQTDTLAEQYGKTAEYLWKSAAPNFPGVPGTYSTDALLNAGKGKTDVFGREQNLGQAGLSSVGIKVSSYPPDTLLRNVSLEARSQIRELRNELRDAGRQLQRKGISQADYDAKVKIVTEKIEEVSRKLNERVRQAEPAQ